MNRIEKEVAGLFPGAVILEKVFFASKKNQVTKLILKDCERVFEIIAKYFVWGNAVKEELALKSSFARKLSVPQILHKFRNILFMEFVDGVPLGYNMIAADISILDKLSSWLCDFHDSFNDGSQTLLKGDMRLQNFVFAANCIYGIDFEESSMGDRAYDIADMAATLLELEIGNKGCFSVQYAAAFAKFYFSRFGRAIPDLQDLIVKCLQKRRAYNDVKALGYFENGFLIDWDF